MTHQEHPDQRLIHGIVKGDAKILEEIYSKYSSAIFKLVKQNNGTKEDARDVIQDGLIIVFKKARNDNLILTSSFLTYFFAVCRHIWWKKLKNKSNQTVTLEQDLRLIDETDIEKAIQTQERHQFYLSKLAELSPGCQKVLQFYAEGKRMKEIVTLMGFKSEVYARKRKFKCKEQLMNRIKQDPKYKELIK
ncbi:MAG: RNA polymerase sigma factor [Chitinophagales bacterium]